MDIKFTAHNIRLDNGTLTKPELDYTIEDHPWFVSTKRLLNTLYPCNQSQFRIADLGCLEGGYSVYFARMGFQVLGLEVRESNIALCNYVKQNTNLPNMEFVQDNAWNIAKYGAFDVMFCCGLLYHLDKPKIFLEVMARVTKKLIILQTHFSTSEENKRFKLSPLTENESLYGRWYTEFGNDKEFLNREESKWAAWDNRRSFWIQREYLFQAIQDVGFDLVFEQYDGYGPNISNTMLQDDYRTYSRGTFIGIKSRG